MYVSICWRRMATKDTHTLGYTPATRAQALTELQMRRVSLQSRHFSGMLGKLSEFACVLYCECC